MNNSYKKILFTEGIVICISICLLYLNYKLHFIALPPKSINDLHKDIVTNASVFAGFSFTVLGVLISLSSTNIMVKLKETSILSKRCVIISSSIIMFVISVEIALIYLFGVESRINNELLANQWVLVCICHFIAGLILFIISVLQMISLMEAIFKYDKKNAEKKIEEYKRSEEFIKANMKKDNEENI